MLSSLNPACRGTERLIIRHLRRFRKGQAGNAASPHIPLPAAVSASPLLVFQPELARHGGLVERVLTDYIPRHGKR